MLPAGVRSDPSHPLGRREALVSDLRHSAMKTHDLDRSSGIGTHPLRSSAVDAARAHTSWTMSRRAESIASRRESDTLSFERSFRRPSREVLSAAVFSSGAVSERQHFGSLLAE